MAHYAFLDSNDFVVEVIVGIDESQDIDGIDPETWYGNFRKMKCLRTSYNGKIRKNFAGIGYKYDKDLDAFIPPKPYRSWILDNNCLWTPPIPYPNDDKEYVWNEELGEWINGQTL